MDQLANPWWVFVVLGVCAGILSGLMGVGSGIVIVPALVIICGLGQKSAQGTALAVMVPMALVGAFRYWKNPAIELSPVMIGLIISGAVVGALLGTELAGRLPTAVLRKMFAVFLIIAAVRMLTLSPRPKEAASGDSVSKQESTNLIESGDDK